MGDRLEVYNWHRQYAEAWTEKRPAPPEMTDTQRIDWLGEHCDKHEYFKPTQTTIGHHVIICDGQRTVDASFRGAIDLAAAKYIEANDG